LLMRSSALADVDLVALIGRHGLPHARAIARRPKLNASIADLIRALDSPARAVGLPPRKEETRMAPSPVAAIPSPANRSEPANVTPLPGVAAEAVRQNLRRMMLPSEEGSTGINPFIAPAAYAKLRET